MTAPPLWAAERTVSLELAARLLAAQFPELGTELGSIRPEPFAEGWDNTAYLVRHAGAEYVFRFPRRAVAVELIRTEAAVLPVIAPRLSLPVPVPRFVGEPGEEYPWPFAGYRRIPGQTACRAGLNEEERVRAAPSLAGFLRQLHAVPPEEAARAGAGPDTLARVDVEKRRAALGERLDELCGKGILDDVQPWRDLNASMPAGLQPAEPALVHGDFYVRHLLVDDARRPCGVIDWGDVHLGERAVDLSLAWSFLPPAAREGFRDAYGPVDEETWIKARFRALFHSVMLLLYAADVADADLVREARTSLHNVLAKAPV